MYINQTILNQSWWTNPRPRIEIIAFRSEIIISLLAIILAIIIVYIYRNRSVVAQNYSRRWSKLLGYCALSLLMVLFSRWQTLPFLGSHLVEGLIISFFIAGALILFFVKMFKLPKQLALELQEQTTDKYLPKPKGK